LAGTGSHLERRGAGRDGERQRLPRRGGRIRGEERPVQRGDDYVRRRDHNGDGDRLRRNPAVHRPGEDLCVGFGAGCGRQVPGNLHGDGEEHGRDGGDL